MRVMIKRMSPVELIKATIRPTGLGLGLIVIACASALVFLAPLNQYVVASILGLGLIALFAVLSLHVLALTRWMKQLEHRNELHSLEWQQVTQWMAKFEAYANAADLNVGRIAMLQAKLETWISELELGFDRAGVRISELEDGLERGGSMLNRFKNRLNHAEQKTAESIIPIKRISGESQRANGRPKKRNRPRSLTR